MDLFSDLEHEKPNQIEKKGVLYTDGASRGNPGLAGCGAIIKNSAACPPQAWETLWQGGKFLGETTNNVAEYEGLILGITNALEIGITNLTVKLDSNLIVEQMNGNWKVKKAHLKPLFEKAKHLSQSFIKITFEHVRREHNTLADQLANQAIDQR